MSTAAATEYLGRLLNRAIEPGTVLRLSSAQRARFGAWLQTQGIAGKDAALTAPFSVETLVLDATETPDPPARAPASTQPVPAHAPSTSLGIDLQSVTELLADVDVKDLKGNAELRQIFTLRELTHAEARPAPLETLAGIYAAKEAIRKSMGGAALATDVFRAIEVLPDQHGKPTAAGFDVSISHSGGFAIAVACRSAQVPAETAEKSPGSSAGAVSAPLPLPARGISRMTLALVVLVGVLLIVNIALLVRLVGWRS
jgi:phosphopantetheine--protein transferase-like protein